MDKRVAICCSGEIRHGRFSMYNHKHFLVDYFKSLGYIVDFYFYTDSYNSHRKNENGILSWKRNPINDNTIIRDYFEILSSGCDKKELVVTSDNDNIINTHHKGLILQLIKIHNVLKLAVNSGKTYEIVIRYRTDGYFKEYPNIPNNGEMIQTFYPPSYMGDQIQIFDGTYLKKLVDLLDSNILYNNFNNNPNAIAEIYFNNIFNMAGLTINKQDMLFVSWRGTYAHYFKYICWKYVRDYISEEGPPYKIVDILNIINTFDTLNNKNIKLSLVRNINSEYIYFYDYCDKIENNEYKKLLLSAFLPNIIICNEDDELYEFIKTELNCSILLANCLEKETKDILLIDNNV